MDDPCVCAWCIHKTCGHTERSEVLQECIPVLRVPFPCPGVSVKKDSLDRFDLVVLIHRESHELEDL